MYRLPRIIQHTDLSGLFPTTAEQLHTQVQTALEDARKGIAAVIAMAHTERTFINTLQASDRVTAKLNVMLKVAWTLQNVSPDENLRNAAAQTIVELQNSLVDLIENNVELYHVLKEYQQNATFVQQLNPEASCFLQFMVDKFEKQGLALSAEQQMRVKALKKEIAQLKLEFDMNISAAHDIITVTRAELAGCPEDFIESLSKDELGRCCVGVDYPTYFTVIDYCAVETTRQQLWKAFNNRAYPSNEPVLKKLIAARDAWAKALGFKSYADLELSDEMAQSCQAVHTFLDELATKSFNKVAQEMALLKNNLPAGVTLTEAGQFKPWDLKYAVSCYKQQHLALDENKIKEYFPMQKTMDEMLDIYSQFFGVDFRQENVKGLWHEDVVSVGVYERSGAVLGYILLDMYPRPQKYSHGCMESVVPAVRSNDGTYHPPVIIIITNFNKPMADSPALFSQTDVSTLFHEFGHALHALFGATECAAFAGTNVKLDFVEMPSQLLEEWLFDADMLKKISGHYKTGEPLPDHLIATMIEIKRFDIGLFLRRQVMQGKLSLMLFEDGAEKDPAALHKTLVEKFLGDVVAYHPDNNFQAGFGHLGEYGSRYYCYMWSKVYALDMFEHIKKSGLLNDVIGKQYAAVLGKGGSVDPNQLMVDFLGRQPTMHPFLKDCGLA